MHFSKTITGLATLALAALGGVQSAAISRRAVDDATILQFALTLEHLEATFYAQYLAQFSAKDFEAAGYPFWARQRIAQVAEHEAQHVSLLTAGLTAAGASPVAACQYNFPVKTVKDFVTLAAILEEVGVGAYLGAAPLVTSKGYLAIAGSILVTESRHQAWIQAPVNKGPAWSGPEETAITPGMAYTAAAQFITSCPSTNAALPFTAYPALTIGTDGTVTYTGMAASGVSIALIQGLDTKLFPITNGKVTLPATQGYAYAVATTAANATSVSDANIVAGPYIMFTEFLARTTNPAPSF